MAIRALYALYHNLNFAAFYHLQGTYKAEGIVPEGRAKFYSQVCAAYGAKSPETDPLVGNLFKLWHKYLCAAQVSYTLSLLL